MAKKPETEQGASGIALVSKRKWGYDVPQVDEFLERAHKLYESEGMQLTQKDIQNVSFDMRKGGYAIAQVDAALTRLERAVVDKQTTWEITQHGRVAWKAQTEELYRQIAEHAKRPQRKRFAAGTGKQPSYDRKQVDRLVDQIVDKAAAELAIGGADHDSAKKDIDLNAQRVSNVIFTQRRGRRGYDERQVDYYINACVQLLSRIESYARVADYVGGPDEQAAQQSQGLPQFTPGSGAAAFAAASATAAVPAAEATQSFDALREAEQTIFTPSQPETSSMFGQSDQPASNAPGLFDQPASAAPIPTVGTSFSPASSVPSFDAAAVNQQAVPAQTQAADLPSFATSSDSAIRAAQESLQGSPSLAALAGSHASAPAEPAESPSVKPSFDADQPAAAVSSPTSAIPAFDAGFGRESGSASDRAKLNDIPGVYTPAAAAASPYTSQPAAAPVSAAPEVQPVMSDPAATAAFASPFGTGTPDRPVQASPAPVVPPSFTGAAAASAQSTDHAATAAFAAQPTAQPAASAAPAQVPPAFTPAPSAAASTEDTASAAQQPQSADRDQAAKPASAGLFPEANPGSASGFGFDIPDLSFPTWNDDDQSGK
ncbi:DivIVA domain-containing protein [Bifidobacterium thermophilum]|uniref:DivIVA domain-containing protein n=1 Tax=Bifidobacterium thermophilum TaxID=33905 RepID=UPI0030B476A8